MIPEAYPPQSDRCTCVPKTGIAIILPSASTCELYLVKQPRKSLTAIQYFNEVQRSQYCVYSGSGVNHLRKYLETTIHDPCIAELVEDELEDMTPSDADNTSVEPYLEGKVTVNDPAFMPYSIAPHEISPCSQGYTLPAPPAAPLPPSQQLHRTQAMTGTSRSRLEGSRQNCNGLYSTTPPAEMEHLGAPCWVAPGVTQDSRGSWQTSQSDHNEGPYGE